MRVEQTTELATLRSAPRLGPRLQFDRGPARPLSGALGSGRLEAVPELGDSRERIVERDRVAPLPAGQDVLQSGSDLLSHRRKPGTLIGGEALFEPRQVPAEVSTVQAPAIGSRGGNRLLPMHPRGATRKIRTPRPPH